MNDLDEDLRRDLEDAFGRDLPGDRFDRAVMDRIAEGGGVNEIALAAPPARRWLVPAIAAAVLAFFFLVPDPDEPAPAGGEEAEVAAGAAADGLDFRVRVTDAKDRAMAGAKLLGVIKTWPDGKYRQDVISGETDAEGNCVFEGLTPKEGKYAIHVAAFAAGHAFESFYGMYQEGPSHIVTFSLRPADPLTVRFLTAEGKPIPGVLARPAKRTPSGGEEHSVYMVAAGPLVRESAEDGTVVLDHYAKGDEAMIACRFPSTAWEERTFTVTGEPVEIRGAGAVEPEEAEDVARIPAEDLRAGDDERKRYFLIGPTGIEKHPPSDGFGLLLVLPGGDGGAGFRSFSKRIALHALDETWVVAQLVSVAWTPGQFETLVWPTEKRRAEKMEFTTEEFIEAVVKDVAKRRKIDRKRVFIMGWSSSGPALYAAMLEKRTPLAGAFIAMSVFRPGNLPSL